MYIVWLLFMGLIVGFIVVPIAQRLGYSYGRFGRGGDLAAVVVGTLLGGILLTILASVVGGAINGTVGAIIGGIIGAIAAVVLLSIFATKAANDEPNTQEDIAGPH